MYNSLIYQNLIEKTSYLTPFKPNIYFRETSSNILVSWEGTIPDEKTTLKIEEVLKQFGNILPNHCREANFILFRISH